MDRFIELIISMRICPFIRLKSNMDRFIAIFSQIIESLKLSLKSNMDRFIGYRFRKRIFNIKV